MAETKATAASDARSASLPGGDPVSSAAGVQWEALNAGASPVDRDLFLGAIFGSADRIAKALERGADVGRFDQGGLSALGWAAASPWDYSSAIAALLAAGADPELGGSDRTTPLAWACMGGSLANMAALVEGGANVDRVSGIRPLSVLAKAVAKGDLSRVELLLRAGADPNLRVGGGESPLMAALRASHVDCALALARAGALVAPPSGESPLALLTHISKSGVKLDGRPLQASAIPEMEAIGQAQLLRYGLGDCSAAPAPILVPRL